MSARCCGRSLEVWKVGAGGETFFRAVCLECCLASTAGRTAAAAVRNFEQGSRFKAFSVFSLVGGDGEEVGHVC